MTENRTARGGMAGELALLLLLATLWGTSYSFIKLGICDHPPITLIGLSRASCSSWSCAGAHCACQRNAAAWGRFDFQARLNSMIPWTLGRAQRGCGTDDHP